MKCLLLASLLALVSFALMAEDTVIPNVKYKSGNAKVTSASEGEIVLTKTDFIFRKERKEIMRCPLISIKEINGGVVFESPGIMSQLVLGTNEAHHRLGNLLLTLECADESIECWYFRTTDSVDDAPRFLSIIRVAVARALRLANPREEPEKKPPPKALSDSK